MMMMRDESSMSNGSRLCILPDNILLNILSLLSIKESVRTSVLSKRYISLYASLPDLNFNIQNHDSFINRVLALRDDSIKVNTLVYRHVGFKTTFEKVFNYSVCHGVQQIDIISISNLPACFYSSKPDSLIRLNLINDGRRLCHIDLGKLSFKHLVSLSLDRFMLKVLDVFSDCHSLRYLRLRDCYSAEDKKTLNICAPQISKLMIKASWDYHPDGGIKLSVPRLTMIDFTTDVPVDIRFENCDRLLLEKATISICYDDISTEPTTVQRLITMLEFARHAKFVTLSWNIIKCLSSCQGLLQEQTSPFQNLNSIQILPKPKYPYSHRIVDVGPESVANVLTYLLKDSPNAEINGSPQPVDFRNFKL